MNNETINEEEQSAPVIEKIKKSDLKQERNKLDLENDSVASELINSMLALNEEELDKAIAFVKNKIEILKNKK